MAKKKTPPLRPSTTSMSSKSPPPKIPSFTSPPSPDSQHQSIPISSELEIHRPAPPVINPLASTDLLSSVSPNSAATVAETVNPRFSGDDGFLNSSVTQIANANPTEKDSNDTIKAAASTEPTWCELVSNSRKMSKKGEVTTLPSGELCVTIPNDVIIRNQHRWTNFILAQFQGQAPSPGAMHAIANDIWSRKYRDITVSKLSSRSFLIRIPNNETRARVLAQGMWHIEGQSMFVAKWEPGLKPIIPILSKAPVWIELRGVPPQFFSREGLEHVVAPLGDPKFLHPATENLTDLEVARVFTVVDLLKPIPEAINVRFESGEVHKVLVHCPWLPPTCDHCKEIGHTAKRCPTAPISCTLCSSIGYSGEACSRRKNWSSDVERVRGNEKKKMKTKFANRQRSKSTEPFKAVWREKGETILSDDQVQRSVQQKEQENAKGESSLGKGKEIQIPVSDSEMDSDSGVEDSDSDEGGPSCDQEPLTPMGQRLEENQSGLPSVSTDKQECTPEREEVSLEKDDDQSKGEAKSLITARKKKKKNKKNSGGKGPKHF